MLDKVHSMSLKEKEELINKIAQTAQYYEVELAGCARCTVSALQKYLELCDDEEFRVAIQAADPLSGGIGGNTHTCGALIGGVMAIGLAYSPDKLEAMPPGTEARARHFEAFDRASELVTRFQNEFGGLLCRDVQKALWGRSWDLRNREEWEYYSARPQHDRCGEVTGKAARLAVEVILEPIERIPRLLPE